MASRGCLPWAVILLTTVCLDVPSVVAVAVARDPSQTSSYNLDKGPVFYEAYYPDAYRDTRYPDYHGGTVLERSFQVPTDRFAYSAVGARSDGDQERASRSEEERREEISAESRRDYEPLASVRDQRSTIYGDAPRTANVGEISELVRRAISRDLENWDVLERYLDRAVDRRGVEPRGSGGISYLGERRDENAANGGDAFRVNRVGLDSLSSTSYGEALRRRESAEARADENAMTGGLTNVAGGDVVTVVDSPPPENIFRPRPQIVRYRFFERPAAPLDEQIAPATDDSTPPRNYGDNLVRGEIIAGDSDNGQPTEKSDVKVTSIRVSELPHKTRHHHGEWPKRDYAARRRRRRSSAAAAADYPVVRRGGTE